MWKELRVIARHGWGRNGMCPGINSFASSAQPIANYVPCNQQSRGFKHRHHRRLVGSTKVVSGPVEGYTEGIWVAHTWRCLPCVRLGASRRGPHTSQKARCVPHPGSRSVHQCVGRVDNGNEAGMCPGINGFTKYAPIADWLDHGIIAAPVQWRRNPNGSRPTQDTAWECR